MTGGLTIKVLYSNAILKKWCLNKALLLLIIEILASLFLRPQLSFLFKLPFE